MKKQIRKSVVANILCAIAVVGLLALLTIALIDIGK